jgi:hypothetical protein
MRRPINWIVVCLSLLFMVMGTAAPRRDPDRPSRDVRSGVIDELGRTRMVRSAVELEGLQRGQVPSDFAQPARAVF